MKVVPMKAERRSALGRNQVVQLRQQGWMPAVVYGDGQENIAVQVSEWELVQHCKAHHKVFNLMIGGATQAAFLQDVAWHAISDRPIHADFKRIDLTKPIDADVEVTLTGHPVGIAQGGTLVKDHVLIKVRCLPTEIPELIEHDVTKMDLDQEVLASQIVLPAAVKLVTPPNTTVCHVAKLVAQAVPEAAPAVAPAEGAAATGAAPAAGGAAGTAPAAGGAGAPKAPPKTPPAKS
ncbi:MAG: 50S ribosomal protein L25 [Planctomycetota bacterium]|nr:50S ribosomal protein L25 [Planctomycetota bacterium]